jgi:lactoylglutathione lyase
MRKQLSDVGLHLVVLRCADLEASRAWYAALGLTLAREQHDGGAPHYSTNVGFATLELYPKRAHGSSGLRLGLTLTGGADVIRRALALGGELVRPGAPEDIDTAAVIRDPDGHTLDISLVHP